MGQAKKVPREGEGGLEKEEEEEMQNKKEELEGVSHSGARQRPVVTCGGSAWEGHHNRRRGSVVACGGSAWEGHHNRRRGR